MMELDLGPAALGGLAGLIAFAGWAMGWMQAGRHRASRRQRGPVGLAEAAAAAPAPVEPVPASAPRTAPATIIAEAPASPACQQRALEERRALLARPVSLTDLHAEVSAIRRDERILESTPHVGALLVATHAGDVPDCRYIGLSGRPTCPASYCHDCLAPAARRVIPVAPAVMASPERC